LKRVISFLKYRWYAIGLSLALLAVLVAGTYVNGGVTWGLDFVGGVKMTVQFDREVKPADIRKELAANNIDAEVQQYGKEELREFIISTKLIGRGETSERTSELIKKLLDGRFPGVSYIGVETVGPAVGSFLKKSAAKLAIVALFFMTLYLAFRFEIKYSAGVLAAVLHDVILSFFFCGMFGIKFNIPIVAALLTIFGFSVNDTIVIFDRVRENIQVKTKQTFTQILDASITETLSRTFITSLTVLFCVLSLYLIGEGTISDFALVMLFGLVSGTYSTIYIASPVVLWWERLASK
jgi:preprotein translocase subunit SecF